MKKGLFDTHAHLSDTRFDGDRMEALDRAAAAGISAVVEVADSPEDWEKAIDLCRAASARSGTPTTFCSLGLHPYYADRHSGDLLKAFEAAEQSAPPRTLVAVGEIGLDYVKAEVGRETQIRTLEAWLAAAKEWRKPVVIHCRGAFEDLRPLLKNIYPAPPQTPSESRFWGVIHCFSGTESDAHELSRLGFALGVDGPVTYPKNEALRKAFKSSGVDALVLETDSPYLPPQALRGKRNEPALLRQIASKAAEILDLPESELAARTTRNALDLFGISPTGR